MYVVQLDCWVQCETRHACASTHDTTFSPQLTSPFPPRLQSGVFFPVAFFLRSTVRSSTRQPELSPLSQAELNAAEGVMEQLTDGRNSFLHWFLEPVNAEKWGLVDYSKTILRPMDLSTVSKKLQRHEYPNITSFMADLRLLCLNCYRYNGTTSPIAQDALRLEQLLDQKITLMSMSVRQQVRTTAPSSRLVVCPKRQVLRRPSLSLPRHVHLAGRYRSCDRIMVRRRVSAMLPGRLGTSETRWTPGIVEDPVHLSDQAGARCCSALYTHPLAVAGHRYAPSPDLNCSVVS